MFHGSGLTDLEPAPLYDIAYTLLMLWVTQTKDEVDAMDKVKRMLLAAQYEQSTGIPAGIAAMVGPRVNPKERAG